MVTQKVLAPLADRVRVAAYHCEVKRENVGPLLFVFDEAIFQHEIRNFGLFQAKTSDYGL